jgi:hypothetical protein
MENCTFVGNSIFVRGLILVFLLSIVAFPVWSVTKTASTGDWSTAGTWTPAGEPTGSDDVIIPAGVTVTISVDISVFLLPWATVNTITVNGTLVLNTAGLIMRGIDILTVNTGGQIIASGVGAFISSGLTFFSSATPGLFPINGPTTINGGTLPITLLFFNAQSVNNSIIFKWASATEVNFDYYRVEFSTDGKKFEQLAIIPGVLEDSDQRKDYEYVYHSPRIGKNYYRLASIDLDGSTEYFDVISLSYDPKEKRMDIFPNPIKTDETVVIQTTFNISLENKIIVQNLLGDIIYMNTLKPGSDFRISTQGISSGTYIISLSTNEGVLKQKLIIQ